jgi:hypothetical protein
MKARQLKVGDIIRITAVPGEGIANYTIHPETTRVYKKLVARGRPVRIREIDEFGLPWYRCRFKMRNGKFEMHGLIVIDSDTNWVLVKRPKTRLKGLGKQVR